jgi:hypothetical protein
MDSKQLIGPGVIIAFISLVVGEYTGRVLRANFYARYSGIDMGDAALMMYGFLLICMYVPLIAGGFGAMLFLLSWLLIVRKTQISVKQGCITTVIGFITTAGASLLWAAFKYFFLGIYFL